MELGPCVGKGGASGTLAKLAGISLSSENRGATWSGAFSRGIGPGGGVIWRGGTRGGGGAGVGGAGVGGWAPAGSDGPTASNTTARIDPAEPRRGRSPARLRARKIATIVGPRLGVKIRKILSQDIDETASTT